MKKDLMIVIPTLQLHVGLSLIVLGVEYPAFDYYLHLLSAHTLMPQKDSTERT